LGRPERKSSQKDQAPHTKQMGTQQYPHSNNIHIDWLEFAAIIVNYAGIIVTTQHDNLVPPFLPMIQLNGDNKTGNKIVT
jgi:hypothetical protein